MKKAYLVLGNGRVFEGEAFGACCEATGEIIFNTSCVGYIETLTDPSYAGQIILQTFPLMGNYGIIEEDFVGKCTAKGLVVREWCDTPSNFRSEYDIDKFLKDNGVAAICGVDTREITRIIREEGTMNASICFSIPADTDAINTYKIEGTVEELSCKEKECFPAEGESKFNVTVIDYGSKAGIIPSLCKKGCSVTAVPYNTSADEILAANPDGIVLSNGAGNPADNEECIEVIKALLGKVPMLGWGLGHQMAALAAGGKVMKLKYGHHGGNQPVKKAGTTKTYITSQNHSYAVAGETLGGKAKVTYINANDNTCEGLEYPALKCISVQFHPEDCINPTDTHTVLDSFIEMMGGKN